MTVDEMMEATQAVTDGIRAQTAEAVRLANISPVDEIDWRPLVLAISALTDAVLLIGETSATSVAVQIGDDGG